MTLDELKQQRRWVLHKAKVPYQPNGRKAMPNNPGTWNTYAECAAATGFDGLGIALGNGVWGVDIDGCCDAVTGKFTAESREIVIALDSYGEYSPSGTGCHVLGGGKLTGPGIKKPFPGCKAIEVKSDGFYFTFTGRHLSKTPHELMDRQTEIAALYNRLARSTVPSTHGMTVNVPVDEEARFAKLWVGDKSDYDDDDSKADFVLCQILARRFNNDPFRIFDEVCKSGCYRDKWDRPDYRARTILRAIGHALPEPDTEWEVNDGGETEFVLDGLDGGKYGLIPLGEVSVIGGASGVGKSTFMTPLIEDVRNGRDVLGHKCKPRDYRLLLHDRSKRSVTRMAERLGLSSAVLDRIVRLTPEQQKCQPAEVAEEIIEQSPGIGLLAIEALDFWIPDLNKLESASAAIDALQRVAIRRNIAILATVGTPKQKGGDKYQLHRDALIGSSAIGRKTETVILLEFHDPEDPNSTRKCTVLPRDAASETYYFEILPSGLVLTDKPQAVPENTAMYRMECNVMAKFKPGELVVYSTALGPNATFYRWRTEAVKTGKLVCTGGRYYLPHASTVSGSGTVRG